MRANLFQLRFLIYVLVLITVGTFFSCSKQKFTHPIEGVWSHERSEMVLDDNSQVTGTFDYEYDFRSNGKFYFSQPAAPGFLEWGEYIRTDEHTIRLKTTRYYPETYEWKIITLNDSVLVVNADSETRDSIQMTAQGPRTGISKKTIHFRRK